MNIPPITLKQVRDEWRACYPAERLAVLYAEPRTIEEVLTKQDEGWKDVPPQDRAWTVAHVLPHRLLRVFALNCAEQAAARVPDIDPRVARCNAVLRGWLAGKANDGELDAAQAAAWAAVGASVEAVSRAAACDAARAAQDAARSAAWAAAWAAAGQLQLATLLALINGTHKDCWLISDPVTTNTGGNTQ